MGYARLLLLLFVFSTLVSAQPADTAAPSGTLKSPAPGTLTIKQIGGLDLAKMEAVGAPAVAAGSGYIVVSTSKTAAEIAKQLKIPEGAAEQVLSIAKTTPGQAVLAGVAMGAGTIFVINKFGVEGSDGFFVVYKYWIALGMFLAGALAVVAYRVLIKKA